VSACLDQFEAGDLSGWWRLIQELQLEPRSTRYLHELNDNLAEFPGWLAADDATKARLLEAAKLYVRKWRSSPDEWIGTHTIHYPDFAGYRALLLIATHEPEFLDSLDAVYWANAAASIIGFPTSSGMGSESETKQKALAKAAYERAPKATIAALERLIDKLNSRSSTHLFELRRVDACWDNQMADSMLAKARNDSLNPAFVGDLLEALISRGFAGALAYAKSLVVVRTDERSRAVAREAATVLWTRADDRGWDVLWPAFMSDRQFFRDVITDVADDRREARLPRQPMAEDALARLYILLADEFPRDGDPEEDGAHFVSPRESVARYRDNALAALRSRGTAAACRALERIKAALPEVCEVEWALRAARRIMLLVTWAAMPVDHFRELTSRRPARLVRNGRDLQRLIIESLGRLQLRLQGETPTVRSVWDYSRRNKTWEPIDECALSDYIANHLRDDLRSCGIVALREVEIRRGDGSNGQRTDIYVATVIHAAAADTFETVRVIVEVKGCWNSDLKTAMESQLKKRYLCENDCEHGFYVVGWFQCESWNIKDSRRRATPRWTLEEAREFFRGQQARLSEDNCHLESVVLDTSLR
jgi:hypothetical protein